MFLLDWIRQWGVLIFEQLQIHKFGYRFNMVMKEIIPKDIRSTICGIRGTMFRLK